MSGLEMAGIFLKFCKWGDKNFHLKLTMSPVKFS